jgi:hypothetical protein
MEEMRTKSIPLSDNVVPSNATAIHLTSNGYCQEETYGIPFFAGVAPNWTAWSSTDKVDKAAFQQGDKYASVRRYKPVSALLTKPFYQVIKAPAKGVVHGVYRKFLGLSPGHTYRLTACLTTLNMDSAEDEWSLSLCAAPVGPGAESITSEQFAGRKPLPDGRSGPQAGRIAMFNRSNTTKGNFQVVFSKAEEQNLVHGSHITLPVGVDSLVVWARFECEDPNGEVGLSGVRLEDLTAIANPKTTEQILNEEADEEERFLRHVEKALRLDRP